MAPHLTNRVRQAIHSHLDSGWSKSEIAAHLQVTVRQVRYAASQPITPRKKTGRPRMLTYNQVQQLIQAVEDDEDSH